MFVVSYAYMALSLVLPLRDVVNRPCAEKREHLSETTEVFFYGSSHE